LKQVLCLIYENRGKGLIVRSKTRWIEQGEKPTKYFFNLEKRNYNKTIKELKHLEGKSVTKEEEIPEKIEILYRKLYTSILLYFYTSILRSVKIFMHIYQR